jgi:hypothetical protein
MWQHLSRLLHAMGLRVHTREGWQTKELREQYGLKKTKSKAKQSFDSHAVDAWVLAASISGAEKPTCTRLWYTVPMRLHRRQLHRLQASKGGNANPMGGHVAWDSNGEPWSGIPGMAGAVSGALTVRGKPSAYMTIAATNG